MKILKSRVRKGRYPDMTAPPVAGATTRPLVPRAAIVYLIGKRIEHFIDLRDSLGALQRHFLRLWRYPVIVFHEGLSEDEVYQLRAIYDRISFVVLDLGFPAHIDPSTVKHIVAGHASVGYRHMCRFYSGAFQTKDIMLQYDWYSCALAERLCDI